ncbi:MAG: ATP synthase F0 subunit B [Thermodesulfovibrionales bacterium]
MKKVQSPTVFNYMLFTIYFLLLTSAAVFANEGGEAEPSLFKAYLWPVINFIILIVLLTYAMKKADIKGFFRKRTELIEQSLKEAKEAKELAQKALAEVEDRLKMIDKEVEEIIASAKLSGEKEKGRLVGEGDKLKEKILEQAKTNIDFEVKQAKATIKKEAVEIAMELAEKKLKEKLTKEEQLKLLEESVAKIEGKN